jgi:hypothetical protein
MTAPLKIDRLQRHDVTLGDPDAAFARTPMYSECMDAGIRASRQFHREYPGWKLYCRIVRGDYGFDRDLSAWAIGMARSYTRARKTNGRDVVAPRARRNDWVAVAGMDALAFVIYGRFPASFYSRARALGVHEQTYRRVTSSLGACMLFGFENYRSELHYAMRNVCRQNSGME